MTKSNLSPEISVGSIVELTDEYLNAMSPVNRARYAGREATARPPRLGATGFSLLFPAAGRRKERRLFDLNPRYLKLKRPATEAASK